MDAGRPADGQAQGGLSVQAPNVWKVATGFTGRRAIVDNAKCNNCHGTLGVTPTFHAGQRNDGADLLVLPHPEPHELRLGRSSKYFIHAIHGGRQRTVNYTWHAAAAGPGYYEVDFPGTLNTCTTCHVPNTFDFTDATNLAAIPNMELYDGRTGKYDTNPPTNPTYYTVSPYVVADNLTDYGVGFSYNATTNTTVQAAGTTLVLSPITGACSACHDSSADVLTYRNGGLFYATRTHALSPGAAGAVPALPRPRSRGGHRHRPPALSCG